MARDYYAILGVTPDADAHQIRSAYRRLARQHHPDVCAGPADAFLDIQRAYESLSDPEQRQSYDRARRTDPPPRPGFARRASVVLRRWAMRSPHVQQACAQVVLDPAEAAAGAALRIDIPVEEACPVCDGLLPPASFVCAFCGGEPVLTRRTVNVTIPPGVRSGNLLRVHLAPAGLARAVLLVWISVQE